MKPTKVEGSSSQVRIFDEQDTKPIGEISEVQVYPPQLWRRGSSHHLLFVLPHTPFVVFIHFIGQSADLGGAFQGRGYGSSKTW